MNDFLTPSEIDLVLFFQEEDLDLKPTVTAGVKDAFIDSKARPILTYLCCTVPSLLKSAYGVSADQSLEKKLIGTKAKYDVLLEEFLEGLEALKVSNIEALRNVLPYTKYPFGPNAWLKIEKVLQTNQAKIKNHLSVSVWKYLQRLRNIIAGEELNEDDLTFIQTKARFIPDKLLARYLQSLETDPSRDDAAKSLQVAQKSEASITKKYFKTAEPKATDLKAMQEKFPDKYKEWKKATNATKKAAKSAVVEAFKKSSYNIVDVKVAKSVLKDLSIPNPIDPGFVGKVGLGDTKAKMFLYYTKDGKLLDSVVGQNVKMNPKYSKDNDTYYCTHMPAINSGIPVKVYTAEHRKKSAQKLHNGARESVNGLEDLRPTLASDIKPILNGKFTDVDALAALVIRVIDETAGRIGNPGSEQKANTFGIHNLKVKHAKKSKGGFLLKYIGKKGIPQSHKVEDAISVKAITKLIADRSASQYIFSRDGERPLSPTTVGMYLKGTGFRGSPHRFRKIWANKIFNELAFKDAKKKMTKAQAKEIFDKAVSAVAAKLGQTESNTSIRSYIDPLLMKKFWDTVGFPAPAVVLRVIENMGLQDPDSDD